MAMDPGALLGGLLGGGLRGPASDRLGHAMGERGLGGQGGPFGDIMGQLGGGPGGGMGGGGLGGLLSGLAGMLGGGGGAGGGIGGGALGGLGALGGMLGGGGRGEMGAGGMGMLAMLAIQALRNSGQGPSAGIAGAGSGQPGETDADPRVAIPEEATSEGATALVLKAMINAAKADGEVDADERQQIVAKAGENGAGPDEQTYLEQELAAPMDTDALVAAAGNKVLAGQVYAASLLAITVDSQAERAYLQELAQRLGLDPTTVGQLHQNLNVPQ